MEHAGEQVGQDRSVWIGTLHAKGSRAARSERGFTSVSSWPVSMIVVRTPEELQRFEKYLFGARSQPVVMLTQAVDGTKPVLPPQARHSVAGSRVRMYLILGGHPMRHLAGVLGRRWAPPRGSARICWPGFGTRSDPADHPLVQRLDGESDQEAIEEFARQFDLSRPRVRQELRIIEDLRAETERELRKVKTRLREVEKQLTLPQGSRHQRTRRVEADASVRRRPRRDV
jgi:hypothetical protein